MSMDYVDFVCENCKRCNWYKEKNCHGEEQSCVVYDLQTCGNTTN